MAAASIDILEPGSPTAALATQSFTRSAATVHREEVAIGNGSGDTAIAEVLNADPTTQFGLVTRNIPSGVQPVSDGGSAITVDALDLDIRNLSHTADSVRIGDGTDLVLVSAAGALLVDASATTQPVSGTVTANVSDNATRDNGKVDVAALDQYTPVSGRLPVDGSGVTQPVSAASLPLPTGAATSANQLAAGHTVTPIPATSGGLTTFHLISAATTNATSVKAAAGQLYGYYIYNSNAAARKVAFHNTAGTPTAGASIFFTIVIPAGSAANVHFSAGIAFSTGIGFTTVTGLADNDSAAVALNDLCINLFYK